MNSGGYNLSIVSFKDASILYNFVCVQDGLLQVHHIMNPIASYNTAFEACGSIYPEP